MGGKSIGRRAANERDRARISHGTSMKEYMEAKASLDRPPPTRDENKCQACGFKARFKFIRCPECDEVYKEPKNEEVQK